MDNKPNENSEPRKNAYYNDFVRGGVYYLRMSGMKYKDIEALTGVNQKSARSIVVTIEKNGSHKKGKSTGRKPKSESSKNQKPTSDC